MEHRLILLVLFLRWKTRSFALRIVRTDLGRGTCMPRVSVRDERNVSRKHQKNKNEGGGALPSRRPPFLVRPFGTGRTQRGRNVHVHAHRSEGKRRTRKRHPSKPFVRLVFSSSVRESTFPRNGIDATIRCDARCESESVLHSYETSVVLTREMAFGMGRSYPDGPLDSILFFGSMDGERWSRARDRERFGRERDGLWMEPGERGCLLRPQREGVSGSTGNEGTPSR